jgi:predicted RNA methylase
VTTNVAIIARFRTWADGLNKQIEHLGRSMTQNPTPKRNREYQSRLHDCRNLERLQKALRSLADGHEQNTLLPELKNLKTRDEIRRLVRKGLDNSRGGYYSVIEADDYAETTPQARQLQAMIDAGCAIRERKRQIEALQAEIALMTIPGYFPTPAPVVREIFKRARLYGDLTILEPSAGSGHIADALVAEGFDVHCVERHERLRQLLVLKGRTLVGSDFIETEFSEKYDRVLMNPPFEKGQDMAHVRHAYEALKPGGVLVAIMAPGFEFRSDRQSTEFRDWLTETDATWENLPDGSFKQSGTGVSTRLVVIEKAAAKPKTIIAPHIEPAPMSVPIMAGQIQTLFGPQFHKAPIRKPAPPVLVAVQLSLFGGGL